LSDSVRAVTILLCTKSDELQAGRIQAQF